jgi:predicted dehydrogenase
MKFPSTSGISRRRFLQTTGIAAMALRAQGAPGANDQVRIGLIGCGRRGSDLAGQFSKLPNVRIIAVSDPDTAHMDEVASIVGKKTGGTNPEQYRDYRKLLEREDIDAVVIASPNHWHALHTIHACQAGKDVYVEKPASHDIWAGQQMAAAAKLHKRIVQAGTQNRSDVGLIKAFDFIRQGNIGKIKSVRGLCLQNRESIGKVATPIKPPATVDYNLWLGPAMDEPIYRPHFHYDWHWVYNTGNGNIGNQGPHELDLIRWVLGDPPMPAKIQSFGGRFAWNDAGETANMQAAWFTLNEIPVIFEVNDMRLKPDHGTPANCKGIRVGIIVTCEGGEFRGGRGGGYVVGPDDKTKLAKFPGDAGAGHTRNFIDAIRSRRTEDLRSPIDQARQSADLSHLANISLRCGTSLPLDKLQDAIPDKPDLQEIIARQQSQLRDWNVDLATTPSTLGAVVTTDPETGTVLNPENAVKLYHPEYRKEFTVPEIG